MTNCKSSKASLEAANANRGTAAKLVADSKIRAPFSGVVAERFVDVGQYVKADTKIVSLYSIDPLRLELTVPESSVGAVQEGMTVYFRLAAFGDENFESKVRYVSPNIRRTSRDMVVEAVVENSDRRLRAGMFAVSRLLIGEPKTPSIPLSAARKDGNNYRVFVLAKSGTVEERIVQIGEQKEGFLAVAAGLREGESVVVQPSAELHDGSSVQVISGEQ